VIGIEPEVWTALAEWARGTKKLPAWPRTVAAAIGRSLGGKKRPMLKQAAQAERLLEDALRQGFRHESVPGC
jgi:hypothetical protein